MLTLDNFETQIARVIVQRGAEYYDNGNVTDLEETADGTWTATVEGTDSYTVEVKLDNKDVIDYFCDCPYDGPTCKHVAAVLFTLQEVAGKKKSKKDVQNKTVFESLLQTISLKEYQNFIRIHAAKHKDFKTEFELFFADKDTRVDVDKKYTELVNKLIKRNSDRGFIDYRGTSALAREIYKLLKDGDSYIQKQNYRDAFALARAILRPMMEAITQADDSSGGMGGSIFETIMLLGKIADSNTAAVTIKEQVFQFLQTELKDKLYFEYGDYGYEMLEVFQSLAVQLNNADAFLQFIDKQIESLRGEYENYRKEYLIKRKIEFLQQTDKQQEAARLIEQSMDIVEIRMEAVNKAIEKRIMPLPRTS